MLPPILSAMPFLQHYLFCLLSIVPVMAIFERMGFRPYWALLLAVPEVGLILCLLFLVFGKRWRHGVS
jgi:hypothetical protein